MHRFTWLLFGLLGLLACEPLGAPMSPGLPATLASLAERDFELELCRERIAALRQEPDLGGAPQYERSRIDILGRALGEPMLFVRPPAAATKPGGLRDGYVFSEQPAEAFALVRKLSLSKLFDGDELWLQRGDQLRRLSKATAKRARRHHYQYADGPQRGRTARLLFGDRVAASRDELRRPLHRDARSLRERAGFERMRVEHRRPHALLAQLRFAGNWVDAMITSDGARLELGCVDANAPTRARIADVVAADRPRRRALAQLRRTVTDLVAERLPFDRPRGVDDHFSDGQLRPLWNHAYRRGWRSFEHEEATYRVFDGDGRPHPPQMCVETIVDTLERAAGSWYQPLGQPRERRPGPLDFTALGLHNRAGVIAFETFARERPEHFEHRRLPARERIQFRHRERFFAYLLAHADRFQPGDVIAIQGPKADGYVHQHAILIEDTDPLTGFPHALFDQMKRPRRRTFEMIMAEAPKRSLLYQVRLQRELLLSMATAQGASSAAVPRRCCAHAKR